MTALFLQHIRNGEYTSQQKNRVCDHIQGLEPTEKLEFTIAITKLDKSKTNQQLKYYWSVVIREGMIHFGYSKKQMDIALKDELLTPDVVELLGRSTEVRPSIAEMKIKPMSDYIDSCINFLGTWGVIVPSPPYKGE